MDRLLDREQETQQLGQALDRLAGGRGVTLTIAGPAGAGKTRLVSYVVELARQAEVSVVAVRCGPLDADLAGGVIRRVVEALDAGTPAMSARAAELAPSTTFAVADPAAAEPVLIAIDDAHWADTESLRWLAHLAFRAPEMRVALVLATRDGDQPAYPAAFDAIAASSPVVIRPRPLSLSATHRWMADVFGNTSDEIAESVHRTTAGSPLLIDQLLTDLRAAERLDPETVEAARPRALRDMIAARIRRLGDDSRLTAEAVVILGDDARVGLIAELVDLDIAAVAEAAAALATAHILRDGLPLSFAHPLVRAIVYDLIPAARRQLLHRRAAQLLAGDASTLLEGALHLLSAPPLPDPEDAALLVKAGQLAAGQNAHARAAKLFERALADALEPASRAEVTLARARALVLAGEDAGLNALKSALAAIEDPREVVAVATEAGHALLASCHQEDALAAYGTAAAAAAEFDPAEHRRLLAFRCMAGLALQDAPTDAIRELLVPPLAADRALLGLACAVASWSGQPASVLMQLARAALATPSEQPAGGLSWTIDTSFIVLALIWAERLEEAVQMLDPIISMARERGALIDLAAACTYRAYAQLGRGELRRAGTDVELARRIYGSMETDIALHGAFELYTLVAMGELNAAEGLLGLAQTHLNENTASIALFVHARARLRAAQGRVEEARADFERVGRESTARGAVSNCILPWRSDLARLLVAIGERDAAVELAEEEVALARAYGAPGALGRALVAVSLADDRSRGALEEALDLLEGAGMPLLHADALLQQGMRLRRAGNRRQAQQPLRLGLDLAARCGARLLAGFARSELNACGSRPRRELLHGVASLTTCERRVAVRAAEGRTNREIARELVLAVRTVETHLTSCYRKLGVSSRTELCGFLGGLQTAREAVASW